MTPFTTREKLVLRYLMKGATDKQISQHSGLSTVDVQVATASLLRKLREIGIRNRTQLALWALGQSMAGNDVTELT